MPSPSKSLPVRSYEGRDQLFTVAAPVLAGFSVTLLGVLITLNSASVVRWRDLALLLVTAATFLYLASMRYSMSGRALRITRQDAEAAWDTRVNQLRGLRAYAVVHDRLIGISQQTFSFGSVALVAGLTVFMIPDEPLAQISLVRLLAIAGAGISTLVGCIHIHTARRQTICAVLVGCSHDPPSPASTDAARVWSG
jgi:hypothetical protein